MHDIIVAWYNFCVRRMNLFIGFENFDIENDCRGCKFGKSAQMTSKIIMV